MTNPTPRDSAQLPPLQVDALAQTLFAVWQKTPHSEDDGEYSFKTLAEMSSTYSDAWRAVAREALRAQAASVEPVLTIEEDGYFNWRIKPLQLPPGTTLYAGEPPAHIPTDVDPGHLSDLRYVLNVLKKIGAQDEVDRGDVLAAIVGMNYIIARTETATQPQAVAASSPATAVDAVDERQQIEAIARAHGTGGWQTLDDMVRFGLAVRAALQASRQPQVQQAVAEGAGDLTQEAVRSAIESLRRLKNMSREYFDALDERALTLLLAALATKEQRS